MCDAPPADIEDLTTRQPPAAATPPTPAYTLTVNGEHRRQPAIVKYSCSIRTTLTAGETYLYCTCGRTSDKLWCDSTCQLPQHRLHAATTFDPLVVTPTQTKQLNLCGCRYSSNLPYCDGSHIHVRAGFDEEPSNSSSSTA